MKKYRVFDNNRAARYPDCPVHHSWDNCDFDTFEEAQAYAFIWLGVYGEAGVVLTLNIPWDYSGYGDVIEIREIELS